MDNELRNITGFMQVFDQPILNIKEKISADRAELRLDLILEELHELAVALGKEQHLKLKMLHLINQDNIQSIPDKVSQLDALVDLVYVVKGTINECGLAEVYEDAFHEVHISNMSKIVKDLGKEIQILHNNKVDFEVKNKLGNVILCRADNGKVIKPSTYYKPNLLKIFELAKSKRNAQKSMDF